MGHSGIQVGDRVHHANQIWTFGWTEEQRQANPQWGWGTVLEVVPQHDRTDEVKVRSDAPLTEGGADERWWPSYLIDDQS